MPGDYGGTGGAAREACRGIRGRACSCNTRSDSLQRRRLAGGTLPSSSETSSKDVTDILCEVRLGDCGASSAAGWAAVSAAGGAVCVLCSSASGTGSLCSSAPSTLASAGTSGTSASASCSGTPEPDDSRLLSSEREREADAGRGVVSVASSNESCENTTSATAPALHAEREGDTHGVVPVGAVRALGPGGGPGLFHGIYGWSGRRVQLSSCQVGEWVKRRARGGVHAGTREGAGA
jgi:hypothetical protein